MLVYKSEHVLLNYTFEYFICEQPNYVIIIILLQCCLLFKSVDIVFTAFMTDTLSLQYYDANPTFHI